MLGCRIVCSSLVISKWPAQLVHSLIIVFRGNAFNLMGVTLLQVLRFKQTTQPWYIVPMVILEWLKQHKRVLNID